MDYRLSRQTGTAGWRDKKPEFCSEAELRPGGGHGWTMDVGGSISPSSAAA
jgi:hypothetical protein